jgi:nucleoside-diphosphate-sugar epimerase
MFTVFGASGFIGGRVVAGLRASGTECLTPARSDDAVFERDLGHVIYCIGYTADFRQNRSETIEAHVSRLNEVLSKGRFESLLYLSSTRIYSRSRGDFLASVVRDAVINRRIVLRSSLESSKDYVSVESVSHVLPKIAVCGQHRIYNVASGVNVTNAELVNRLQVLTGCAVESNQAADPMAFPPIDVARLRAEFDFRSPSVVDELAHLVKAVQ